MSQTYTVIAGSTSEYHPRWIDAETLTICENYAESWIKRGPGHWAEIVRDADGHVVHYLASPEDVERTRRYLADYFRRAVY